MVYSAAFRFATVPIRIAAACRKVHAALTGRKARERLDVDEEKLRMAWEALERSWEELEDLRSDGAAGMLKPEDLERFINGWQVGRYYRHRATSFC